MLQAPVLQVGGQGVHVSREPRFDLLPALVRRQDGKVVCIAILLGERAWDVIHVDVKEHRSEDRALGNAVLESSQPAALTIAGVEGEATVVQHLHDEAHHVAVRYCLQELEVESTEPDGVVGGG